LENLRRTPSGRLVQGTSWVVIGAGVNRGFTLVANILSSRAIGAAEFGALGLTQTTVALFAVLAGGGLAAAATKFIPEYTHSDHDRVLRVVTFTMISTCAIAALTALCVYGSAGWFASDLLQRPTLTPLLRLASPLLFTSVLSTSLNSCLDGFEAFKAGAIVNILQGILIVPLAAGLTATHGSSGLLLALLVTSTISIAAFGWYVMRNLGALTYSKPVMRILLASGSERGMWAIFSLPALLSGIVGSSTLWFAAGLLARQARGLQELGIFNDANQWRPMILFVPMTTARVCLPLLSGSHSERDSGAFKEVATLSLRLNVIFAVLCALPVCVASPVLMKTFGSGFENGSPTLWLLAASAVIQVAASNYGQVIASTNRMWLGFLFNVMWAVLIFVPFLFPQWPRTSFGLALAIVMSYAIHTATEAGAIKMLALGEYRQ